MKIVIVSKFCKCEPNDTVSAVTVGWDPYCVHSVQVARCGLSPQGPCVSSLQCGPQNFLLGDPCPRLASQVGHTAQGHLRPSWARPLSTLAHWPLGTGLGPLWAPRLPAVHLLMGRRSAHTPLWAFLGLLCNHCPRLCRTQASAAGSPPSHPSHHSGLGPSSGLPHGDGEGPRA